MTVSDSGTNENVAGVIGREAMGVIRDKRIKNLRGKAMVRNVILQDYGRNQIILTIFYHLMLRHLNLNVIFFSLLILSMNILNFRASYLFVYIKLLLY